MTFLRHGRNDRTAAFGPMADVIQHSTRHLSHTDLQTIAVYILSLPAPDEEERELVAQDDPVRGLPRPRGRRRAAGSSRG